MSDIHMIINGENVATEHSFSVLNPATEELLAQCPAATQEHLDAAVEAANSAFISWSQTSDLERQEKVHQLAALIENNAESLAQSITLETGKAMDGMGSMFEVMGSVAWTHATASFELPVEIIEEDDDHRIELHRRPLGVVGSITPWNFPLMIAVWHIMPAIRAGNTVVLKPSELTPLSTLRMVELFNDVLPPGVLNVVTGGGEIGRAICEHPGIQKIVFTGSTNTGKQIMSGAAPTLKRLTLELGGNDAAVILPDIKPESVAEGIFQAAFVNSGQTCAALKRLYVHEDIYEAMCTALAKEASKFKVGNGLDEGVMYGPIQNKAQFDRVCELASDARDAGGRFLTGGEPMPGPGYFFPLTLVADVSDGVRLVDEEQFGPILPIIKYSDVDDAIRRANSSANGLGGSVWAADENLAKELACKLECGTAWVNTHAQIQPNMPFGGVKDSGFGVEFGTQGLAEYTSIQSVFINKLAAP